MASAIPRRSSARRWPRRPRASASSSPPRSGSIGRTASRFATPAAPASSKEIDDSLRRLQTDVIDLYQVHWPDPNTPIEETAGRHGELHRAGKIRAIGVSNFSPAQMDEFRAVAPLHAAQPPYNLFEREIEADVLPYARSTASSSLAYGCAMPRPSAGKMTESEPLHRRRPAQERSQIPRAALRTISRRRRALDRFAQERYGKRVIHLAVRWVLDRRRGLSRCGARASRSNSIRSPTSMAGSSMRSAMAEIDAILQKHVTQPVGPEFMAPPEKAAA